MIVSINSVQKFKTPTVKTYDMAGTVDKVTMEAGDGLASTVAKIGVNGFTVQGNNGAVATTRQIAFHWTADARIA